MYNGVKPTTINTNAKKNKDAKNPHNPFEITLIL